MEIIGSRRKRETKERKEKQMKEEKSKRRNEEKGITLVALIITIIVLIILAAVTINSIVQINMIEKAIGAAERYEGEQGREGDMMSSVDAMIVGIGGNKQNFTENMIGEKVEYEAGGESEWIILGQEESGNILITTKAPTTETITIKQTAEEWLGYEDKINTACEKYGSTINGKALTARSITLADINRVTEFKEPKFNNYTFGTEQDYANKKVNYYFPSNSPLAENHWMNAEKLGKSETFGTNAYYYKYNAENSKWVYWGEDSSYSEVDLTQSLKEEEMKYILGENTEYVYIVASRSVNVREGRASFAIAGVFSGVVSSLAGLCTSNANSGNDDGIELIYPVRPVISLPSNIQMEKNESGVWVLS